MKKLIASLAVLAPTIAFAQTSAPIRDFNSLVVKGNQIGNTIIGIFIAVAVIFIIYNALMFIVKAGSDDRAGYRNAILWGIVGLAVILSIWGLVAILTNTFGTSGVSAPAQLYPTNVNPPLVN
jgi:fumarate reductase subunit D